jgi:hypothetical protein
LSRRCCKFEVGVKVGVWIKVEFEVTFEVKIEFRAKSGVKCEFLFEIRKFSCEKFKQIKRING